VSRTTILNHLCDTFGMKHFHLRGTSPVDRTIESRKNQEMPGRATVARSHRDKQMPQPPAQWSAFREDVPQRVRQQDDTQTFMPPVIWGGGGFHVVDLVTSQRNFDSRNFVANIRVPPIKKVFPKGSNPHVRRLHVHLYTCRVHFSKVTEQCIAQNHILRVPQPSYSPDLARSDFWLFGHLKTSLVGPSIERNVWRVSRRFSRKFSRRNCNSFPATGHIANKTMIGRKISVLAFPRAGGTTYRPPITMLRLWD
jgi:hypothetical protein